MNKFLCSEDASEYSHTGVAMKVTIGNFLTEKMDSAFTLYSKD